MSTAYTVACVQTDPAFGQVAANLRRQRELLEQAIAAGARLLVLPECSGTGYMFRDRDEAAALAEVPGEGPATGLWRELAARHDVHVVGGFVERDGDLLYNAAALVGPSGVLGVYRKAHVWNDEQAIFALGDRAPRVYDTPLGRIAMHVCYDAWFPETFRLPADAGADLICGCANWVPVPGQRDDQPLMAWMLSMTAAHSNVVYLATANRAGVERDQPFVGRSVVLDAGGWPLASGPADGEAIVLAEIDPVGTRRARSAQAFNHPLRDRRTDLYDLHDRSGRADHPKEPVPR